MASIVTAEELITKIVHSQRRCGVNSRTKVLERLNIHYMKFLVVTSCPSNELLWS